MKSLHRYIAVIKKQFKVEISYKTAFFAQYLLIPISIIPWFFVSKLIDSNSTYLPENYNYFTFVVVGVACLDFCVTIINFVVNRVREEQISGVIEEILLTKINLLNYFSALAFYPMLQGLARLIFYIFVMQFFVNVNYDLGAIMFSFVTLLLTVVSLIGVSMLSASIILLLKKGNYINRAFVLISSLCSGIAYPISVLPESVQILSKIVPTTQLVDSIRISLTTDTAAQQSLELILHQGSLGIIYLFCGIFFLKAALKRTMTTNALTDY